MTVSPRVAQEREARHAARIQAAEKVVPVGCYCYTPLGMDRRADGTPVMRTALCPYWKARTDWPTGAHGFCRFLKVGDGSKGLDAEGRPRATMMLFDQVKECGINTETPDDEDAPD